MLILAEGNIDVVSLHQAGFDCAVASLGTALTEEQARLMSRYTSQVVVAYDNDTAGQKAAQRAIGIFDKTGISCRILRVEGAKDPDEFIKSRGPDAFQLLLERSENHVEYRLLAAGSKYDLGTTDGKLGYVTEAAEILATLRNVVERDMYCRKVAEEVGVSPEALASEVKKTIDKRMSAARRKQEKQEMRGSVAAPGVSKMKYEDPASAVAEKGIIRCMLADPGICGTIQIDESDFTSPFLGRVFSYIAARYRAGDNIDLSSVLTTVEKSEEASELTSLAAAPMTAANAAAACSDYIARLKSLKKPAQEQDLREIADKLRTQKGYGG